MPQVQQKPIIHGRDHMAGGADPIPGLSSGGGVIEITSDDGTIIVTDPTGPIVDLSAVPPGSGVYFDRVPYNTGHTLDCRATYAGGVTGGINFEAENAFTVSAAAGVAIGTSGPMVFSSSNSGYTISFQFDTDTVYIREDSAGPQDILRLIKVAGVWEYHIQTGASWVADL